MVSEIPATISMSNRAHAEWARFEHRGRSIDRLHVHANAPKSWCFVSHDRIVLQALSPGVSIRHRARTSVVAVGGVVVLAPLDAQLRVTATENASFQVLLEIGGRHSPDASAPHSRPGVSQLRAEPTFDVHAHPADVFLAATEIVPPLSTARLSVPVARARDYIEENIASNFSLETLGTAARAKPNYLCRVFQQQTGLPPHRFRAHLRVAQARALLAAGLDCTKVAHGVGFCDQSHFNRSFKELTGTTPGAYARACVGLATGWVSSTAA
ncbi:MAG: Transcriptional regulator, AraC family [Labilithrix sp.]|nr:Transcriptional regulator, AraC family [Labilithrix sp.]